MEVSVDVSVVRAIPASGGRSISKRLMSSAAKCCASAADPPLPQARTFPPAFSDVARSAPAKATGADRIAEAEVLRLALSANWAVTRAESAAALLRSVSACAIGAILLDVHLELDATSRVRMRAEAADPGRDRLASIHAPGKRGILASGDVTELATVPGHADRVGIEAVIRLSRELQPIPHVKVFPNFGRGVIAEAGERRALHQQSDSALGQGPWRPQGDGKSEDAGTAIRRTHRGSTAPAKRGRPPGTHRSGTAIPAYG